ncbi:MAG: hypothetical protein R3Y10_12050, partial [Ferrimonas sp.]
MSKIAEQAMDDYFDLLLSPSSEPQVEPTLIVAAAPEPTTTMRRKALPSLELDNKISRSAQIAARFGLSHALGVAQPSAQLSTPIAASSVNTANTANTADADTPAASAAPAAPAALSQTNTVASEPASPEATHENGEQAYAFGAHHLPQSEPVSTAVENASELPATCRERAPAPISAETITVVDGALLTPSVADVAEAHAVDVAPVAHPFFAAAEPE